MGLAMHASSFRLLESEGGNTDYCIRTIMWGMRTTCLSQLQTMSRHRPAGDGSFEHRGEKRAFPRLRQFVPSLEGASETVSRDGQACSCLPVSETAKVGVQILLPVPESIAGESARKRPRIQEVRSFSPRVILPGSAVPVGRLQSPVLPTTLFILSLEVAQSRPDDAPLFAAW